MRNSIKNIRALLLVALLMLALCGCGAGDAGVAGGTGTDSLPATVSVKTGSIATDSWGYTGYDPVQLQSPAQAKVVIKGRTLLQDSGHVVVTGDNSTRVTFSSDFTTLSASEQASAPGQLIAYLDVEVGNAATALPAYSVTVDAGSATPGETVTVYSYDGGTRKWTAAQTAVVSSTGKVTFDASAFTLWGIFR